MSRAFVREDDQVQPKSPPELKVSSLPGWASPLARALMGAAVGEVVQLGGRTPPTPIALLAIAPIP